MGEKWEHAVHFCRIIDIWLDSDIYSEKMANTKYESTQFFSLCGNEIFLVFEQCSRTSTLDTIHNPFEGIFDAKLQKYKWFYHIKYTRFQKYVPEQCKKLCACM